MTSVPDPNDDDVLSLLVEIRSCSNLLIGDRTSSDPYVKVCLANETLHKTKHLTKTLNPVFASEDNNACVINLKYKDLQTAGGIRFEVKDWDRIGTNDPLGIAFLDLKEVVSACGDKELPIMPPPKRKESSAGSIALCIRHATDGDRETYGAARGEFWLPQTSKMEPSARDISAEELATSKQTPSLIPETGVEEKLDIDANEKIEFVVSVVRGTGLLAADKNGLSDPYVRCSLGEKDMLKTKTIKKTLDPVFDEDSSTFLLSCSWKDLCDKGLLFRVSDWDRGIGGNDPLGTAKVSASKLYTASMNPEGDGVIHCPIEAPPERFGEAAGTLTVKSRAKKFVKEKETKLPVQTRISIPTEDQEVLIEVISCRELIAADKNGLSDPYVKFQMGSLVLHKTRHVEKTLNPVFSGEDANFCIVNCSAKELFSKGGVKLEVKDYDRGIGKNDSLGSVLVSPDVLYKTSHDEDESLELELSPPKGHGEKAGYIVVRIRPATLGDKEDLKGSHSLSGKLTGKFTNKKNQEERDEAFAHRMSLIDKEDKIFLIQIVSCRDLLAADKTGLSDPYCKIKMDGKELHRTKHILKTLNPVFSEDTNSTFVLDHPVMELYTKNGITVSVKDWDRGIGGNDDLGSVHISPDLIYDFGIEPREFKLNPPMGKSDKAGFITLKCTEISSEERDAKKGGKFFSKLRAKDYLSRDKFGPSDLSLLVEIVSCQNLPKTDMNGSDAYVKVRIGDKEIHKTKHVDNNQDPIYTVNNGSLFLLNVEKERFINDPQALTFVVKEMDVGRKNAELGHVHINGADLCNANGDRMTYTLLPKEGSKLKKVGAINIRCRPATNYDRKFLQYLAGDQESDFLGVGSNMDIAMKTRGGSKELIKSKLKVEDGGVVKYRIRPEADPERPAATKWLSASEIDTLALQPSRRWIAMGSGKLGRLYLEIIQADGLPNLDSSISGKDKSDPFAMVVHEDCCIKTDIIDDCLGPRWLPWMQRAFVLNIDHSSSDLFIGIFDYDASRGNNHDFIGRCAVDTSNLRPNTEYLMTYDLYQNSFTKDRASTGSVTVRLRVEIDGQKQMVLSNLRLPPDEFINVKKKKDFHLVQQTVQGLPDLSTYSLKTVMLYVEELNSYVYVQYYIIDAVISLLLWRGQVPFWGVRIPLHSVIAFLMAITLAERPTLGFSYFWFANAWLLLAIQNWRNNTPNPWNRSKSFGEILCMMILNNALAGSETIGTDFNKEESISFEAAMKERIEKAEAAATRRREEEMKILAQHEKEVEGLNQTAATDISTKSGGVSLDPMGWLKPYVYPLQQTLATVCYCVRVAKNVYLWEEPYFASFLVLGSFLIGMVFYLVPWGFLFRWTGRVIAWGLFGPHMKLVDVLYYRKLLKSTEEEEKKQIEQYYKAQKELAQKNAKLARIQTEDAIKMKEFKKVFYGKYIVRVPVLKAERLRDQPLHQSCARPYKPDKGSLSIEPIVIGGQGLVGNMIPRLKTMESRTAKVDDLNKQSSMSEESSTPNESTALLG